MSENAFGDVLKELRERYPLTGEQLAERAQLSQGLISKYENGTRTGTRTSAKKIAAVLATSDEGYSEDAYYVILNRLLSTLPDEAPELRPGEKLTYITDPDAGEVISYYEGLSPDSKSISRTMMKQLRDMERRASIGGGLDADEDSPTR